MIKIMLIILQDDPRSNQETRDVYVPSIPVKGDTFRLWVGDAGAASEFIVQEVRFVEDLDSEFLIQVDLLPDSTS